MNITEQKIEEPNNVRKKMRKTHPDLFFINQKQKRKMFHYMSESFLLQQNSVLRLEQYETRKLNEIPNSQLILFFFHFCMYFYTYSEPNCFQAYKFIVIALSIASFSLLSSTQQ